MLTRMEMATRVLDHAFEALSDNLRGLTLEEALFVPPGGYRSVLGTLKHTAAWSHVYRSYAFDREPVHWRGLDWPRGRRDTVDKSQAYLDEVIAWLRCSHEQWQSSLAEVGDQALDEQRPVHWGEQKPLFEIVLGIAGHHLYHAGEINQLLSIRRGEAWEEGEQVEENLVCTDGHRVIAPWLRQADAGR